MAHVRITGTSPVNVATNYCRRILVTVWAGFTGTITVADRDGTVGVVTNPTAGQSFSAWDLNGTTTVTCSAAGDVLVNTDSSYGPK